MDWQPKEQNSWGPRRVSFFPETKEPAAEGSYSSDVIKSRDSWRSCFECQLLGLDEHVF